MEVYGIAGIVPHVNMDVTQTLPAPVAAMLATMTVAVFHQVLPWQMMLLGVGIIISLLIINYLFRLQRYMKLSVLGVAIGMYLPLSSSFPLFIGGLIAFIVHKKTKFLPKSRLKVGICIACGLIAGSALMDVVLALIFSIQHNQEALVWVNTGDYGVVFSCIAIVALVSWIVRRVGTNT